MQLHSRVIQLFIAKFVIISKLELQYLNDDLALD